MDETSEAGQKELDLVAKKIYADLAEAETRMEALLYRDLNLYSNSVQFARSRYDECEGMTLQERIKQFRDEQSWTEYLGVVDSKDLTGNKQDSDLGFICEYVDQNGGGMTSDDFNGYIYFPVALTLKGTKWLKFYYSC